MFYVGLAIGVMIGFGLTGLFFTVTRPSISPRGCGLCWGSKIDKPCQRCGRTQ